MKALLVGKLHQEAEKLLENNFELKRTNEIHQSNAEIVILRTFTELREAELDKLPKLKYVVSCSVGIDNIDSDELNKMKIKLIHCPGSNAHSVAEHTIYLMLSLLRRKLPFKELRGKKIGIIGLGYIGKLVAKMLLGFKAEVIAFDIIKQEESILKELNVKMKTFDEVLKESDIVSIHVPLNKDTEKLINSRAFSMMKKGSFFLNTSRTGVVDEDALIEQQQKFSGIGLDICTDKPKKLEQAIITNHCAAQSEEAFRDQCVMPVEKLINLLFSQKSL